MKATTRILLPLLCLMLAACGTKKQATSSVSGTAAGTEATVSPMQTIVQTVNANRQNETAITAKMNFSFASGTKSASIGGSLRMKRNEVIQLSLVTFGILEVGRIEVTPDYFMGIDKVNKQYLKVAFQDVPFLKTAGIDFYTLQSLFWDELFLLGSNAMPTEKQFKKSTESDIITLTNADSRHAVLTFMVNTLANIVQQTVVSPHTQGSTPYLTWDYSGHSPLGGKSFPTMHFLTITAGSKTIKVAISLSNLRNDSGWETRTNLPGGNYREVTLDQLMSKLMNLNM